MQNNLDLFCFNLKIAELCFCCAHSIFSLGILNSAYTHTSDQLNRDAKNLHCVPKLYSLDNLCLGYGTRICFVVKVQILRGPWELSDSKWAKKEII